MQPCVEVKQHGCQPVAVDSIRRMVYSPASAISALDELNCGNTSPGQSHSIRLSLRLMVWKCLVRPGVACGGHPPHKQRLKGGVSGLQRCKRCESERQLRFSRVRKELTEGGF